MLNNAAGFATANSVRANRVVKTIVRKVSLAILNIFSIMIRSVYA